MSKYLGKIKVFFMHNPKKIISLLNEYSKEDTLDKIRPKINKMKENHLFVDSEGDIIDIDLESEILLEDILIEKEGKNPKIFIIDPDYSEKENQVETTH